MSSKRVLVVGNCNKDHRMIQTMIEKRFGAEVDRADTPADVERRLADARYDLVLVNRQLFADDSDGVGLLRDFMAAGKLDGAPAMLISNFPQAQEAAAAVGAVEGFGKANLTARETVEQLAQYLTRREDAAVR